MKKAFSVLVAAIFLIATVSFFAEGKSYSGGGSSSGRSYSSGSSSFGGGSRSSSSYSSGSSRSYSSPSYSSGSSRSYSSPSYSSGSSRSYSSPSSGGSKSYSSGSSGKSYSSGSSSSGKSYSSGSSSSGKSYSSGSSSSPSGKSYSSGGSSGKSYSGATSPSGKSYSSGSPAGGSGSAYSSPSGKSYSSSSASKVTSGDSKKPQHSDFNAGLSKAAKEQESKIAYQKATAPKPVYTDPKGKEHKINPADKNVQTVRNITNEHYVTRETRVRTFYEPYYSRPVVYYSDPFGPFFYLWLFDRCSANDRAMWAYQHRSEMDDARWRDMCAKDAQLEARVRQLEAEKAAKDPGYVPPGIPADQKDLMYNDQFVRASYNAEAVPSGGSTGWIVFWTLVGVGVVGTIIYLVFFKNYNYNG